MRLGQLIRRVRVGMAGIVAGRRDAPSCRVAIPAGRQHFGCDQIWTRREDTIRNITIFAATLGAILALAAPTQAGLAEMVEVCNQARKPDLKVDGCTVVIRSGEFSGGNLARAPQS